MERYYNLQVNQLHALNNQNEARLTRTKSVAFVNEWRQKHNVRNYQSEYDRTRNELSNSAIPFQPNSGLKKRTIELQQLGVSMYNIISYFIFC